MHSSMSSSRFLFALFFVHLVTLSMQSAVEVVNTNEVQAVQKAQYDEIERYLDKQIAEADRIREASWKRDFSNVAAYEKSVDPWRQNLIVLLGGIPYTNAPLKPREEVVSETPTHRAYRVWLPAFDDVSLY